MAEKTELADRYLLDEVSAEERIEFEAHFFDCPICSEKVRGGAIFIDAAREVLRNQRIDNSSRSRDSRPKWGWFGRISFATLLPSLATVVLACIVGYQNLVTIPVFERPQLLSTAVIAPLAREEAAVVTVDRRAPRFNLNFMVDSPRLYSSYTCDFKNESGREILTVDSGPRDVSSFTLSVLLASNRFPDGRYEMTLKPQPESNRQQRYTFVIRSGESNGQSPD